MPAKCVALASARFNRKPCRGCIWRPVPEGSFRNSTRLNSRPEAGFTKSSGAGRTRSSTAKNYVGAYISCSHLVNNKSAGAHDGMDKDVHDVSLQSIFQRWHIRLQYSQWYQLSVISYQSSRSGNSPIMFGNPRLHRQDSARRGMR